MNAPRTDPEILARLCLLAAEQVSVDSALVTPESDFFNDLNFDSLDAVEYVMKVEEAFDVTIGDEHADGIRTPRQAFELLAAARAGDRAAT